MLPKELSKSYRDYSPKLGFKTIKHLFPSMKGFAILVLLCAVAAKKPTAWHKEKPEDGGYQNYMEDKYRESDTRGHQVAQEWACGICQVRGGLRCVLGCGLPCARVPALAVSVTALQALFSSLTTSRCLGLCLSVSMDLSAALGCSLLLTLYLRLSLRLSLPLSLCLSLSLPLSLSLRDVRPQARRPWSRATRS